MKSREQFEQRMCNDDETTAQQLENHSKGLSLSIDSIQRCRSILGQTFRRSSYCQLIHRLYKIKRYDWAIANCDDFCEELIYTDQYSVMLETLKRYCCRKIRYPLKPKPKHPVYVQSNFVSEFKHVNKTNGTVVVHRVCPTEMVTFLGTAVMY